MKKFNVLTLAVLICTAIATYALSDEKGGMMMKGDAMTGQGMEAMGDAMDQGNEMMMNAAENMADDANAMMNEGNEMMNMGAGSAAETGTK